jgi:hypothetical protein
VGRPLGAVLCASLLFTLSACGDGDDDKATAALSKSLRQNDGAGDFQLSQKQADCVAENMVDNVGTDDLQKYGILNEDMKVEKEVGNVKMSEGDAKGAADAMTDCVDAVDLVVKALGDSAGKAAGDCLRDKLKEDDIHDFFQALFQGDQDAASKQLMEPMMGCATAGQ